MSLDLGTLVGFLEIDKSRWDKGIDSASTSLKEFENKEVPKAKKTGEKVGEGIGKGVKEGVKGEEAGIHAAGEDAGESFGAGLKDKAKAGALLAGAAVTAGLMEGLNVDAAGDKLVASLGVNAKKGERLTRIASDVYAGAWGESTEEVNLALGSVVTSIEGMRKASDKELSGATKKALDFASAFDVDVARSVQVAGTLISSGLAKDSTEAFDLLTKGSQQVPVQLREDLQDASEEYGQFFAGLGFSGEEAFAMLVDGSEKGVYGIDKVGDAVKEFTIRSTDMSKASKEAYGDIGLNAREMADDILAGGDSARRASRKIINGLLDIESPSKRAEAAIALFGTPIEDLNTKDIPDFLRNMRGASDRMDDFRGASKRMGDELNDNAKTRVEEFTRGVKTDFVQWFANEGIPFIEDELVPAVKKITGVFDDMPSWAVKGSVGGVLGLIAAGKLGSLASDLRGLGGLGRGGGVGSKVLGKATPVPVFVTNPGFGGAGGAGGGKKPGILAGAARWLPPVAAAAVGWEVQDRFPKAMPFGDDGWMPGAPKEGEGWLSWFQDDEKKKTGAEKSVDRLKGKITEADAHLASFGDHLDLVGNKKVDPALRIPGLPEWRDRLDRFYELEVKAGRPIEPNLRLLGYEPAMQKLYNLRRLKIGDKTISIHTKYVDPGEPDFLSGGGASVDGERANGGRVNRGMAYKVGERGTEVFVPDSPGSIVPNHELAGVGGRGGVGFDFRGSTIQAHDYDDFVQQMQKRSQQRGLGGSGPVI